MDGYVGVGEYDETSVGQGLPLVFMRGTIYCKNWAEAQSWCKWAVDHRRPFMLMASLAEIGFRVELTLANDETIKDNMVVPK